MVQVDVTAIREGVRKRYADASLSTEGRFQYLTGRPGALALGYESAMLEKIPDEVMEVFCGVGNPFALGEVRLGDAVLDVGCGAGVDLLVAAQLAGPSGKVSGLDLTPEMVDRARENVSQLGVSSVDVRSGAAESMPFEDETFDVVISNGVLNLSPLKEDGYREIYRVFWPGGRLQFADIVLKEDLPADIVASLDSWSD